MNKKKSEKFGYCTYCANQGKCEDCLQGSHFEIFKKNYSISKKTSILKQINKKELESETRNILKEVYLNYLDKCFKTFPNDNDNIDGNLVNKYVKLKIIVDFIALIFNLESQLFFNGKQFVLDKFNNIEQRIMNL